MRTATRFLTPQFAQGLMLLGGMLLYLFPLLHVLAPTDGSCALQIFMFSLGFILTFGCLFAKTWRLQRIFNSNRLQAVLISNRKLLGIVGALLFADTVSHALLWLRLLNCVHMDRL